MNSRLVKVLLFLVIFSWAADSYAQARRRTATRRTTTRRTTNTRTRANITNANTAVATPPPAAPEPPPADTLPIRQVKKSLRLDQAVDTALSANKSPLVYENLRSDDAAYRQRIWREIDAREKINLPFRYSADADNGNQRFISILLQAIQDSAVTVFSNIDDRFTTPLTKSEVAAAVAGPMVPVPIIDSNGVQTGVKMMRNEISLDSFYKFRIKEEVVFDKESSRLFWRILGIAPVARIITSSGVDMGESELFWVYYPDLRPVFARYEVYNGKNFGARMSWEELFESRMFSGRIIKSSIDNPYDLFIKNYKGYADQPLLQLMEGERIKDAIFNYEQDLWEY